uniref:KHA domain-containing protein n=1 Tax=Eptatretus burgeri TaxID=7764 RepID=A0A8C4QQJ5_EPTBU
MRRHNTVHLELRIYICESADIISRAWGVESTSVNLRISLVVTDHPRLQYSILRSVRLEPRIYIGESADIISRAWGVESTSVNRRISLVVTTTTPPPPPPLPPPPLSSFLLSMRRVTLFPNGSNINGKMAWVLGSLSDLLTSANKKLGLARATLLYNAHGARVDDVTLIQDDDVLYVSEGENFIPPPQHYVTTSSGSDWITLNVGGVSFTTTSQP